MSVNNKMDTRISSSTISKLEHKILEIRVRTLKHIESKITRALLQKKSVSFHAGCLLKHLIRWFGQQPLCEEEMVLNLMLVILRSEHSHEAIKFLGLHRVKKEVNKIYEIVKLSLHKKLACDVKQILEDYVILKDADAKIISEGSTNGKSYSSSECIYIEDEDDEFSPDYEKPWSTPSLPDYNSLKYLRDSLASENESELDHAFAYLQISINDYPAEYFLQPPYIFKALSALHTNRTRPLCLLDNLVRLTKSLCGRIKARKASQTFVNPNTTKLCKTQITVSRFCTEVFSICLERLKDIIECINEEEPVLIFSLLSEVLSLMQSDSNCYISTESTLLDLAYIAKHYRQTWQLEEKMNRLSRTIYIMIIALIVHVFNLESGQGDDEDTKGSCKYETISEPKLWPDAPNMELEHALLDLPLRNLYAKLYERVEKTVQLERNSRSKIIKALLKCEELFAPAVRVLKFNSISDEEFILEGSNALDMLSIFLSFDFVKKMIKVISRCTNLFDGNVTLRQAAESTLIRLFAHQNLEIQRLAYKEATTLMKQFFGRLLNGGETLNKMHRGCQPSSSVCVFSIGIPLNVEILTEIVCFGCQNSDVLIQSSAEIMISLVMKAIAFLDDHSMNFLEILIPNVPLLQCMQPKDCSLETSIVNLLNPDNNFPNLEIVKGNVRYLFFNNTSIRQEALARLTYILSSHSESHLYVPNINQISDTIPNNICITSSPRNPNKLFCRGLYDRTTVAALLELLKSPDVGPPIRKTTLLQLNVICQDPELVEFVYCESGWYLALQALENSLKKNPESDYPDSAIPAVGIISKIALCNPQFRQDLSNEENIYVLLLRALFLFHEDIILQQDCTQALFLLAFSSHIVGSIMIYLPAIFKHVQLPIKCEFHWSTSPFQKISFLEEVFLDILENEKDPQYSTSSELLSLNIGGLCENNSALYAKVEKRTKPYGTLDINSIKEHVMQHLRLSFAICWFNGFDFVLERTGKSPPFDLYKNYLEHHDNVTAPNNLDFNKILQLNRSDTLFIKYTSNTHNITKFLKRIKNATTFSDISANVYKIKLCLMLPGKHGVKSEEFVNTFQTFILMAPRNDVEMMIFQNVVLLLIKLFESNDNVVYHWIKKELKRERNVFLRLIKNYDCPFVLHKSICNLLKLYIQKSNEEMKQSPSLQKRNPKNNQANNNLNDLFDILLTITEECFHKHYLDRFRILLSILRILSSSITIPLDSEFIVLIAKKMLYFVITLKTFTKTGSHLIKNSLFVISNLAEDSEKFFLDENGLRFLSGMCAHEDAIIRALSWNILDKVCNCLAGASRVVKELSYLPGGFHACCMSTFLDTNEVPLVREGAGAVFAKLLSYKNSENKELYIELAPVCTNLTSKNESNGFDLLMLLLEKYNFFQIISDVLQNFYISDMVDKNMSKEITTCGIVETYCVILTNLVNLKPSILNSLMEDTALPQILELIKYVPMCTSKSSLKMVGEICNVILISLKQNCISITHLMYGDRELIRILISLLNVEYLLLVNYEADFLLRIMHVLRILCNELITFQWMCDIISAKYSSQFIAFLCLCLESAENADYQNASLMLMTSLLISGQLMPYNFTTISEIFDSTEISAENANQNQVELEDMLHGRKTTTKKYTNNNVCGSVDIFYLLKILFENNFTKKALNNSTNLPTNSILIGESLAALLKTSQKARLAAQKTNFLQVIMERFSYIFKTIGMPCTDFIRKQGDIKKSLILQEFMVLFGIILNWYSSTCLENKEDIGELTKILIQSWPWINHSNELRCLFVKCLAFLSEHSIAVCKEFSTTSQKSPNNILKLTSKMIVDEINKLNISSIDQPTLHMGLRVIINCCSCVEGRLQIIKNNLLDTFSKFHPRVIKNQKCWNKIIVQWLQFWEIFSRYAEGATVRYLSLICQLILKGDRTIRNLCLSILRNMAFLSTNRPALLSSEDFLYTVCAVLKQENNEEIYVVLVAIWRLLSENYKSRNTLKGTPIPLILNNILKNVQAAHTSAEGDLLSVLEIVINLLQK